MRLAVGLGLLGPRLLRQRRRQPSVQVLEFAEAIIGMEGPAKVLFLRFHGQLRIDIAHSLTKAPTPKVFVTLALSQSSDVSPANCPAAACRRVSRRLRSFTSSGASPAIKAAS